MVESTIRLIKIKQDDGEVREIGRFDIETKTFYTTRSREKHYMKKLQAWGIDAKAFHGMIEDFDLQFIVLTDIDRKVQYKASVEEFDRKGQYLHFKPHRAQVFLAEDSWEVIE